MSYPPLPSHAPQETRPRLRAPEPHLLWPGLLLGVLWAWAILTCAETWRGNPNYSYGWTVPLLALGFAIRRFFRLSPPRLGQPPSLFASLSLAGLISLALILGLGGAFLEYAREQVLHPTVVSWTIAGLAVLLTLTAFFILGGRRLARAEFFPVAFFLTAVPWPPRLEQPITSTLMRWVALATTETLHWLGIEAQASGGAIAMHNGLVGITEACSGIRSLQAGVMFGLAMGEWFLLSRTRRAFLVIFAILLALATNLGRTLLLTLHANAHGIASVDQIHDLVGNIMVTVMVLAIWIAGKMLSGNLLPEKTTADTLIPNPANRRQSRRTAPIFATAVLGLIAGLVSARAIVNHVEASDATQTNPYFTLNLGPENQVGVIPHSVWEELHPTSGEYVHRVNTSAGDRGADCFHFFWKPSPWNRFALVHRPDICMPGVGWQLDRPAELYDTVLNGHTLRFYVFRFHRGTVQALELWGAWRNGDAVPIDYRPDQVLGTAAAPESLHLEGKRRSATEILSCSIIGDNKSPPIETAVEILRSAFSYNPR